MPESIRPIKQYLISFFALFVTLISFIYFSLQIIFISILWVFSSLFTHVNHKLPGHNPLTAYKQKP